MVSTKTRIFAALATASLLGATVAFVPAAQAYPPGTALSIAASAASAKTSTSITFTARGANAASGSSIAPSSSNKCTVTFSATGLTSKSVTASSGTASTTFAFTTTGIKTVTASTSSSQSFSVTTGTGSAKKTTVYRCGNESASTNVTIYNTPVAPTVTSYGGGVGTARIAWSAETLTQSGGFPVSYYTATLYGPNSSTKVKFTHQTTGTSDNWFGLTKGTYYVAVTATTAFGTSPSSTKYAVTVT